MDILESSDFLKCFKYGWKTVREFFLFDLGAQIPYI